MDQPSSVPTPPEPEEQAGEIFGPTNWQPYERRRFLSTCVTMIISGLSGYAAHPYLVGNRRQEFAAFLEEKWQDLNNPRQRKNRPLHATNDLNEDRRFTNTPSRFRPITLDQDGLAYQSFLYSLNLCHIKPIELLRPHFKTLGNVNNHLPPRELWKNIAPTLRVADALREKLNAPLISINSAFRSTAYNSACPGAAPQSYHTRNMALDLVYACSPEKVFAAAQALRSQGLFKGGIGVYSSFTHIDTRGRNAEWGSTPKIAKA
ncbi:hypothetical protein FEM03_11195 [Phragmitibacter flavus]|uniref:Peptidase M15A C-terminal domain-containing protein n=1 Tax=Phragmitibacter flavus TaxID=2576071 RepID=A0A5R8KEZ3_9BACT|nr:D-Ala-D-Ala carboxypeptidase family metallohydrolase [Phragmitibacter flavus]TLD70864.1 hypothetical protein FEM03_11195 [Phragmitibacter flavus]